MIRLLFDRFNILFILIGAFGFWWFSAPFVLKRVINIGNITGMAVMGALVLMGVFWRPFRNAISNSYNGGGKIPLTILAAVVSIVLIVVVTESVLMFKAANVKPQKGATIVVLGCKVLNGRPSRVLQERINAAYDYLVENEDSYCIASGGQGKDEAISEAQCIYENLVEKGIDKDRIFIEDKSTSTRENLLFSKEIIEENNLNSEIAICTNEFHEYRAGKVAKKLNIKYSAVSAGTIWWLFPTYVVREYYGIVYEWLGLN